MSTPHRLALTLPLVLALLSGCSRQTLAPGPDSGGDAGEQAAVASAMSEEPSFVDDDVAESESETALALDAGVSVEGDAGDIRPLRFWRAIRHVERRFDFQFSDPDSSGRPTTAVVTVHKFFAGSFNLVVADSSGDTVTRHVIRKPLADHWVRRLLLRRVRIDAADTHSRWRVVATSAVEITSRDAETRIVSLRVQSGALDTTLTDPLAFHRLRRVLRFDPGAEVTLTATTQRADDVVLLYLRDRRGRFHNNGDGTHTAVFRAPDHIGLRHLGVNALSRGTLFDADARYDSHAWIEPYVVHPLVLLAGTPEE